MLPEQYMLNRPFDRPALKNKPAQLPSQSLKWTFHFAVPQGELAFQSTRQARKRVKNMQNQSSPRHIGDVGHPDLVGFARRRTVQQQVRRNRPVVVAVGRTHLAALAGAPLEPLHPLVVALVPAPAQFLGDARTAIPASFSLKHLLDLRTGRLRFRIAQAGAKDQRRAEGAVKKISDTLWVLKDKR